MASPVLKPDEIVTYVVARFRIGEIKFDEVLGEVERVSIGYEPHQVKDFKEDVIANLMDIGSVKFADLLNLYAQWWNRKNRGDELSDLTLHVIYEEIMEIAEGGL